VPSIVVNAWGYTELPSRHLVLQVIRAVPVP
jgi:hypothetical protein